MRAPKTQETKKSQKWEIKMKKGRPSVVFMNGVEFVSIEQGGVTVCINNEGLCISGNGINIKTLEYEIRK